MWEFMQKGGPIMWPIFLCSVIAFAIVIERLIRLRQEQIDTKVFMEQISKSLKRNKIMEALDLCERTGGPIANILKAGILKHDRPRNEIREAIEDASVHEVPRLERNLPVLATVAHVAPLLGLLGTVTGLVAAFQVIESKASALNPVNPGDLAGGVARRARQQSGRAHAPQHGSTINAHGSHPLCDIRQGVQGVSNAVARRVNPRRPPLRKAECPRLPDSGGLLAPSGYWRDHNSLFSCIRRHAA